MWKVTHRPKRVAVERTKGLVAFDPYVALGDAHFVVGIRRKRLDDIIYDGYDTLDDHFIVDGVSENKILMCVL